MRILALLAVSLASSSCVMRGSGKATVPGFASYGTEVPLKAAAGAHRGGALEVEVVGASLLEVRNVLGLDYCRLNLSLRLRNLEGGPIDLWDRRNGFQAADTQRSTFLYPINVPDKARWVPPGERVALTTQSNLGAYSCEHPIGLVLGGTEIPLSR